MLVNVERGKLRMDMEDIFRITVYENETLTDKWKTVCIEIRSKHKPLEFELIMHEGKAKLLASEILELCRMT